MTGRAAPRRVGAGCLGSSSAARPWLGSVGRGVDGGLRRGGREHGSIGQCVTPGHTCISNFGMSVCGTGADDIGTKPRTPNDR